MFKCYTAEEVPSATGCPRFRDQSTTSETGFVGAEVIKDFVDDLDGYVNGISVALEKSRDL